MLLNMRGDLFAPCAHRLDDSLPFGTPMIPNHEPAGGMVRALAWWQEVMDTEPVRFLDQRDHRARHHIHRLVQSCAGMLRTQAQGYSHHRRASFAFRSRAGDA